MRTRFARATIVLAMALLAASCAARGPSPQLIAELGRADALVKAGCYGCLKDALAIYERIAASPRPPASVWSRAFDAAVLVTVRAKELGLPSDAPLQHARELATKLPPAAPGSLQPTALVDGAAAVIGETAGFD